MRPVGPDLSTLGLPREVQIIPGVWAGRGPQHLRHAPLAPRVLLADSRAQRGAPKPWLRGDASHWRTVGKPSRKPCELE